MKKQIKLYNKIRDVFFEVYKKDLTNYDSDYHRLIIDLGDSYLMYYLNTGKLTREWMSIYEERETSITGQVNINRKPFVYFRNEKTCWCLESELKQLIKELKALCGLNAN